MQDKYVIGEHCIAYKANKFREGKLKMLKDFGITLTEREEKYFNTLTTPRQIEKFVRIIISNRLG